MDFQPSNYFEEFKYDARKRYKSKLTFYNTLNQLPDPYWLKNGRGDSPTLWPEVKYGDIYTYLIDTLGLFTKESMKAY